MKNIKLFKEFFDQEDLKKWNPDRFKIKRKPIRIAEIKEKEDFSKPGKISVLDMVIKLPQGEIKIPFNSKALNEIVDKVLEHEKEINPNWENYYMYLTLHQSFVKAGDSQRRGGAHFDGMQGERYKEKLPTCHSYIISDAIPTIFHTNEFDPTELSYKDNWFKKLSKQVDDSKNFIIKPYNIYFMTAYHLHSSVPTFEDTFRTFIRIEFSLKKFDRDHNTRNKLIPVDWNFTKRDIPKGLNESNNTLDRIEQIKKELAWEYLHIVDQEEYDERFNNLDEAWAKFIDNQKMGDCQSIVHTIEHMKLDGVETHFGEIEVDYGSTQYDINDVQLEDNYLFTHHWVTIDGNIYEFSKGTLDDNIDWNDLYSVDSEGEDKYNLIR